TLIGGIVVRLSLAGLFATALQHQQVRAVCRLGPLGEIFEQSGVREIELVGIRPIRLRRLAEPSNDTMRIRLEGEFAPSIETSGRRVDGTTDTRPVTGKTL